jgi:hypothetical protein
MKTQNSGYYVVSVDAEGEISESASVTVKPKNKKIRESLSSSDLF